MVLVFKPGYYNVKNEHAHREMVQAVATIEFLFFTSTYILKLWNLNIATLYT